MSAPADNPARDPEQVVAAAQCCAQAAMEILNYVSAPIASNFAIEDSVRAMAEALHWGLSALPTRSTADEALLGALGRWLP